MHNEPLNIESIYCAVHGQYLKKHSGQKLSDIIIEVNESKKKVQTYMHVRNKCLTFWIDLQK